MQQQTLFADTPRSRRSDPETSHIAADRIKASGVLGKQQAAVLEAVRRYPGSTAVEISTLAGIDRYAVSRRTSELVPVYIRRGKPRIFRVSGTPQTIWWPVKR